MLVLAQVRPAGPERLERPRELERLAELRRVREAPDGAQARGARSLRREHRVLVAGRAEALPSWPKAFGPDNVGVYARLGLKAP